nr:coenzyme F420-0:L-glutamate ligase [Treponema denticola]
MDYIEYYDSIIKKHNPESFVILSNDPKKIIEYTDSVLACDIHTRNRTKKLLKKAGAMTVLGLDDILSSPVNGSGFNSDYGLLGSNKSGEDRVKLFPHNAQVIVDKIQAIIKEKTGKPSRLWFTETEPLRTR